MDAYTFQGTVYNFFVTYTCALSIVHHRVLEIVYPVAFMLGTAYKGWSFNDVYVHFYMYNMHCHRRCSNASGPAKYVTDTITIFIWITPRNAMNVQLF